MNQLPLAAGEDLPLLQPESQDHTIGRKLKEAVRMGDTKSKPWRVQKHTLCETHLSRHIFLQLLRPCFQDSFQDSQAPNASCMLPDSRCRHTNVVRDQETDQRDLLQSGRGSTAGIYLDLDFSLSH